MPAQLEFSFGTAQKFFDQSVYEPGGFVSTRTLPVTTLLILGEWLMHPRASVMVHFDLPLEPRIRIADGEPTREYVAPSLSGGIRASAFTFRVLDQTRIEWQFAFLMGSTLADIGRETVFPTLGWRLHLRNKEGLTLYAGATFEFMLNRAALIYGVGQRF